MTHLKTISLMVFSFALLAVSNVKANEELIKESMLRALPGFKIDSIKASEAEGLFEVVSGAKIFYVSSDGKYLIQNDHLIDLNAKKDLTEPKLVAIRVQSINKLGEDKMIVYKPKDKKYKISVFTDIDCGYCRKLHKEMDQYLAEGITVQYLFYPRAGKGSDSYKKAISVWCADDRNAALTTAKNGNPLDLKTCENPIDEHMQLAEDFEVRGTPMIVTEKGTVLPGYVPADRLATLLATE